jgi:imidazoleglycerol phosphate dehydratase HisB
MINKKFVFINKKSIDELGMTYIPLKDSIIDTAYDLINRGKVKNKLNSKSKL